MRQSKETLETMVKGIRAKERELVERYEVIFPAYGTKERITVVPIMTIGVVPRISALKVTPQRYCDTSWRDSSIEGMTPETILLYAKVRVAAAAWMDGTGEFPTPETIR